MPAPFDSPTTQRALALLLLLALPAGVLGSWIVLRRLAFYAHSVGPATFPALTVAQATSVNPQAAALLFAISYAGVFDWITRRARTDQDASTGLILVGSLAIGALLASDVFQSAGQVDMLLFGSVLGAGSWELALAAAITALTILCLAVFGRVWLAVGFDPSTARSLGLRDKISDRVLLILVAAAIVAAVFAVGALLVSALFVVPAATVRLVAGSVRSLMIGSTLLAAAECVIAMWVAFQLNLPPGAALALTGGGVFFLLAALTELKLPGHGHPALTTQPERAS